MDADTSLVVVGGQEIIAAAVDGDVHGVAAQGDAVELFQVAGARLDRKARKSEIAGQAAAGEEETLLGVDGQRRGHAGQRVVGVVFQRTGGWVEGVLGDAVFLLERYVHESGHFITSQRGSG